MLKPGDPMGIEKIRIGIGHDTHRLVPGRPLILGGIPIENELGLAGHSDADIVLHALTDAIFGAAGLGDIGDHFPDTDPAYAGKESCYFLFEAIRLITEKGYQIVNVDVIIHAQKPRLSGYKVIIRESIAKILRVQGSQVNVKAKTGEHVGPVGRMEAMECHAVVLLEIQDGRD